MWVIWGLIVLWVAVYVVFRSLWVELLAVAVLMGSLGTFLLPVEYRLYEKGVEFRTAVHHEFHTWRHYRVYYL